MSRRCRNCGREFLRHRAGPVNPLACPGPVEEGGFHPTAKFEGEEPFSEDETARILARVVEILCRKLS